MRSHRLYDVFAALHVLFPVPWGYSFLGLFHLQATRTTEILN